MNKWSAEDLSRLPWNKLRKLAKQNKINANSKKDELVKALLHTIEPISSDENIPKENNLIRRMTRSTSSNYIEEKNSPHAEIMPVSTPYLVRNGTFVVEDNVQGCSMENAENLASEAPSLFRSDTFICESNTQESPMKNIENMAARTSSLSRSDTFVLEVQQKEFTSEQIQNMSKNSVVQENSMGNLENIALQAPYLVRGATFICEDNSQQSEITSGQTQHTTGNSADVKKPRSSLRFSATPALQNKSSPLQVKRTIENSIGNRILSTHKKKQGEGASQSLKQNKGSTIKKAITKNKATPGSVVKKTIPKTPSTPGTGYRNKFGVSKKLPNFAAIHQKLFSAMESCEDNQKRKLERAQALIQSPVPTCATLNKNSLMGSTAKKVMTPKTQNVLVQSPSVHKKATPIAKKPLVDTDINRFGFKNCVKKNEAKEIIGKKLPPNNMEHRKDQERTLLKGVRMNRRFMLQMQMRRNVQEN